MYAWERKTGKELWKVKMKELGPAALAVSPDGNRVAVAGKNGEVALLDPKTGKTTVTLKGHKGAVRGVAFASDSAAIATGGEDGTVRLWNPNDGKQEYILKGHTAGGRGGLVRVGRRTPDGQRRQDGPRLGLQAVRRSPC